MLVSKKDFELLRKNVYYIKIHKFKLILSFICIISNLCLSLIQPIVWGKIVLVLFNKESDALFKLLILLSILYLSEILFSYIQRYIIDKLTNDIVFDIKNSLFKKILDLPIKAFDEIQVGEFISRIHRDANVIANMITNQLLRVIVDIIKLIILIFIIFKISLPLSLVLIIAYPLCAYIFIKFGKVIRRYNKLLANNNDIYFSNIQQTIICIRDVLSLGIRENRYLSFMGIAKKIKNIEYKIKLSNNISQVLSTIVIKFANILVIALGAYYIFNNELELDMFIAFNSYSTHFLTAISSITMFNTILQQIMVSIERVSELKNNLNYPTQNYGNKNIKKIHGVVEFKNVFFKYKDNNIISDISFKITNNKLIALVGYNGSGKTTIFNLLLRFYDPIKGMIMIDGINIEEYDEETLRNVITIVHQAPNLFHMSIKDNFKLVRAEVSDEEIVDVCKKVSIHQFIDNLPDKYDTIIGENGVNLSGGQKQKIAIARALIKKSKIILFDEVTSSLDNEAQDNINNIIKELSMDHTIIIIAHRLNTVLDADEIMIIEDGKISNKGTHDELIKLNTTYKHLFENECKKLKKVM
jgi:ATP-binding cassette subfamily B protein